MLPAIDTDALLTFLTGLLNTASPTGYAEPAIAFTEAALQPFPGLTFHRTRKGALVVRWQGEADDAPRALTAHADTLGAMVKGSSERYRQGKATDDDAGNGKLVPEGVEGRVPYKGPISPFLYQMLGGLRAGMGYCGAKTIDQLRTDARFVQVSPASVRESHPHDIAITQEAPNYTAEFKSADGG